MAPGIRRPPSAREEDDSSVPAELNGTDEMVSSLTLRNHCIRGTNVANTPNSLKLSTHEISIENHPRRGGVAAIERLRVRCPAAGRLGGADSGLRLSRQAGRTQRRHRLH